MLPMATGKSNQLTDHSFTIKTSTFLFLLISLVTSSGGFSALRREKRGSVKVGDLPQIKPPVYPKKGEQKFATPGWTHCIKYLTADVRWRSIRSVNIKKLQATQFQCSWYISSEVPGSQIRISFEKLEFGGETSTCTQQFLEIIDIKIGGSQGRICGEKGKRQGDYVSAGQRVRIDIQGEEPLVAKIRANKEPFIISYKVVKEVPGFRLSQGKNVELKNKVKTSLGQVVDRTKTIYGTRNQPGANDPTDEPESGGRNSLTIWQVVIIIVISLAVLSCIIGVVIKRMVFDKKKKEEYLKLEEGNLATISKEEKDLPGMIIIKPPAIDKKPHTEDEKPKRNRKPSENALSEKEKEIPRSSSKPEESVKKPQKAKRHNSHGDLSAKPKVTKNRHKTAEEEKPKPVYENTKPKKISPPQETLKPMDEKAKMKTVGEPTDLVDDTPSNRPARRCESKIGEKESETSPKRVNRKKKRQTDENKNNIKTNGVQNRNSIKTNGVQKKSTTRPNRRVHKKRESASTKTPKKETVKSKTETDKPANAPKEEVETPPSRAEKVTQKRAHEKKRTAKSSDAKSTATKTTSDARRGEEKKPEHKNGHSHKRREQNKSESKPGSAKKKKTVSSGHKKATTATGKKTTSSKHVSARRTKRPEAEKKDEHPS